MPAMTVLVSIVVLVGLAVCMAGIYALLFDPKFIDDEEATIAKREQELREQYTTNLT